MLEDITTEQIKNKFKTNKVLRFTTIGVAVVALGVLGYFAYRQFVWQPANVKSMDNYWVGLNYAAKDSTDMALDELAGHKKKYDGKVGGEVAQFVYARQMMNQGEFKKAIDELEGVDVDDAYVNILAVGLQADCYSEMENYEKAANVYLEAADMEENDLTTPMYLMKAGLCAEEINNFQKATECYERIRDDYPQFAAQRQIDKYIGRASSQKAGK